MPRLLLVRHAQSTWSAENRVQGQADAPLSDVGRLQVAAVGERLAAYGLQVVWSSDLSRARDTAEGIAAHHGLSVRLDRRLRELHMGAWEGLTHAQVRARDPERVSMFLQGASEAATPGGESLDDLMERLRPLLEELRREPTDARVVVVSHAMVIRNLVCLAVGLPHEFQSCFSLNPTSLTEIALRDDGSQLVRLNDHAHLEGLTLPSA
ncbi:MAG: histidine phosphatase family protein [Anaerolineae bacterium]|nr:histidine phosphatase family protein [Anaerolineae bacterium]